MKKFNLYSIIFFLLGFTTLQSQVVKCYNCIDKPVYKGDSVKLNVYFNYGHLQWQRSIDLINWMNMNGDTNSVFEFVADSSAYYRAWVKGGECDTVYSDTIQSTVFTWNQWKSELANISYDWGNAGYLVIDLANDSSIWMMSYGKVVRSIDKGKSWQSKFSYGNSVSAVDSLHAWICSADSGILYTEDGGRNWTIINNQMTLTDYIHFFNLTDGLTIRRAEKQEIYTTTDGGKSWHKVDIAFKDGEFTNSDFSNDVIQYNTDTICLSTATRILMSYDKGNSWKWIETGLNDANIRSFAMLNSKSFAFISNWNVIGVTIDAGANWFYNTITDNPCLQTIIPARGHIRGYIFNKVIYGSNPAGTSWLISENDLIYSQLSEYGLIYRQLDDDWISGAISLGPDQYIGIKFPYCWAHCQPWRILLGKFSIY